MVRLNSVLWKQNQSFIDRVRINVRGGKGGNGYPKFGGIGGKGGDIYAQAVDHYSLTQLKKEFPTQRFIAGCGENSKRFCILGNPGEDVIIKCPPGITAISDSKHVLGELNKAKEKLLLARGGCGGSPQNGFIGQKGEALALTLDLKLLADVGFVGFPNAGKSTLLKALSRAQPKIASYPFTTVRPNIGILKYKDFRVISAADLPGLIEGAHQNYGMGHKFLKHCIRTKMLLFIVDITGFRLNPSSPHRSAIETIMCLNKEVEMYEKALVYKPAILAVNKMDCDENGTKFSELKEWLKNMESTVQDFPRDMRPDSLVKFDAVVPVSAKNGTNTSLLKDKIRAIIDITHEEKTAAANAQSLTKDSECDVIYA